MASCLTHFAHFAPLKSARFGHFAYLCTTFRHNHYQMEAIDRLRRAVEVAVSRKMSVYSDFKWLAQEIYKSTHEQVSYMTLMRVWGYVGSGGVSKGTLNILAHFLGYMSYEDFAAREATEKLTATVEPESPSKEEAPAGPAVTAQPATPNEHVAGEAQDNHATAPTRRLTHTRSMVRALYGVIALLIAIVGWGAYAMMNRQEDDTHDGAFILHKGERFATYEDYLSLFGITEATEHLWSQPLPHHSGIIVFGGQYKHPRWGNLGDSTDLLPTRTEYWHDDSLPPEVGKEVIREHYYVQRESNRLIITFMKDLVDTCFVFCGVYRMSLEQSDTTHVVWVRVADRLDLRNLDYLEQLRN